MKIKDVTDKYIVIQDNFMGTKRLLIIANKDIVYIASYDIYDIPEIKIKVRDEVFTIIYESDLDRDNDIVRLKEVLFG